MIYPATCPKMSDTQSGSTTKAHPSSHTRMHPIFSLDSVTPKWKRSKTLIGHRRSLTQLAPDRLPPTSLGESGSRHLRLRCSIGARD
jgi:hypothetical protein